MWIAGTLPLAFLDVLVLCCLPTWSLASRRRHGLPTAELCASQEIRPCLGLRRATCGWCATTRHLRGKAGVCYSPATPNHSGTATPVAPLPGANTMTTTIQGRDSMTGWHSQDGKTTEGNRWNVRNHPCGVDKLSHAGGRIGSIPKTEFDFTRGRGRSLCQPD